MTTEAEAVRDFEAWIGRERVTDDAVSADRARKLAATLDLDPSSAVDGAPLPPGWHWVYFHEAARASELGPDGHEARGAFLPPIPQERRMWAGGRLRFHRLLRIGDEVRRRSVVRSIVRKEGRSGPLVFVTVGHSVSDGGGVAVEEEQDLVYLGARAARGAREGSGMASRRSRADSTTVEADPEHVESFSADEVTLFRFSALTFNGHRIHYDRPYAESEGYPNIVVHGPLLALVLLGAGVRWAGLGSGVRFAYRALAPVFCSETVDVIGAAEEGGAWTLAVRHPRRGVAMRATLTADPSASSPASLS